MSVVHPLRTRHQKSVPGKVSLADGDPFLNTPTAAEDLFGFCNSNWKGWPQVSNLLNPVKNLPDTGLFVGQASGWTCNAFINPTESDSEICSSNSHHTTKSTVLNKRKTETGTFVGTGSKDNPAAKTKPLKEFSLVNNISTLANAQEHTLTKSSNESWPALPNSETSFKTSTHSLSFSNRTLEDVEQDWRTPWLKAVKPNCSERLAKEKWPALSEAGIKGFELLDKTSLLAASQGVCAKINAPFSLDCERIGACREPLDSKQGNFLNSCNLSRLSREWESNAACTYSASYGEKSAGEQELILRSVVDVDSRSQRCRGVFDRHRTVSDTLYKKDGTSNRKEVERKFKPQRTMPAVLLMLNTDFIVASPLKENLLLTLALTRKRPGDAEEGLSNSQIARKVLVGQFKAFSSFLRFGLGNDAKRVATESNAGGTSTISESLSVEYFARRFQARDVITEMEIEYCSANWKKVDYICNLYGQQVGVSVTRAMSYPNPEDFSPQMACRLLFKKLYGLVVARHGVTRRHSFSHCILHVWCETQETAKIMEAEYKGFPFLCLYGDESVEH
ncbi:hypothetical protein O6H91_01G111700 [Diphasiastrum complanatum]|uniref:Uncharacterized protein n=1 Tax=Diphasiastrum complanatum TaxID=34168 RepID=A0ACC2EUQ8_DIPCM|nr:hypothetical protein O6H91_01G111700 [Diphasiastrum complanatum]